jgi:glycosyltransferase involved in cell wall biosynthesis
MKISVITVCFNSASTIRRTLDSYFAQDWPDKELLVIDGASSDATLEVVRSYPQDRMTVLSEPDRGMYDALNKGLRLYRGDAVGVLNSDDAYCKSSALSRIAEALAHADMVHGHLDFFDGRGRVVRQWRAGPPPQGAFRTGWMPAHPTFYVRRAVAEAVGPFDLAYRTASDYDWMLRAIERHAFTLALIDEVLIDMALGGKSTAGWGARLDHNLEALQSRRKWLGAGFFDYALFAKPARKLGQFAAGFAWNVRGRATA